MQGPRKALSVRQTSFYLVVRQELREVLGVSAGLRGKRTSGFPQCQCPEGTDKRVRKVTDLVFRKDFMNRARGSETRNPAGSKQEDGSQ